MANYIFDFDGTVADSLPAALKVFNGWVRNRDPVSDEEVEHLKNLSVNQIMKELRVPKWRVPSLIVKGRREISKHIKEVPVFDGIKDVLDQISLPENKLFIVSSNGNRNIKQFLSANDLDKYFKKIYADIGILGKASALKRVVKDNKLNRAETYYIGDEARDIVAAKKNGLHSVAVTWGYNGIELLKSQNPEKLVSNYKDLIRALSD
jgi:phosphoglycolate phosphatase